MVGVEARGFLLGAAAALTAGTGIVPIRKAGKLPRVAASRSYALEYGTATLELPADTIAPGTRVLVVDDVLATGGTAAAACDLVAAAGAARRGVRGDDRAGGAGRPRAPRRRPRARAADLLTPVGRAGARAACG